MNVSIRIATNHDRNAIRRICSLAFPQQESALVADLADRLLDQESDPPTVTLVAVLDEEIVGHVAFSPVFTRTDNRWHGYILAPLAVAPTYHGHGIGSQLVRTGIEQLAEQGTRLFLVYGDPAYYGRFGFRAEAASGLLPPYDLEYPSGWLALPLERAAIGKQPVQLTCVAAVQDPALW